MLHYGKAASEREWEDLLLEKLWVQLACEGQESSLGRLVSPGEDSGMLWLGWAHPDPLQA